MIDNPEMAEVFFTVLKIICVFQREKLGKTIKQKNYIA